MTILECGIVWGITLSVAFGCIGVLVVWQFWLPYAARPCRCGAGRAGTEGDDG